MNYQLNVKNVFRIAIVLLLVIFLYKNDMHFSISFDYSPVSRDISHSKPLYKQSGVVVPTSVKVSKNRAKDYIEKFYPVAVQEENKYGVPASIKMAQSILESNYGESTLSKKGHNHFGIKYNTKFANILDSHNIPYSYVESCNKLGEDCAAYFEFDTDWYGWRAHSLFLNKPRYDSLHDISKNNYKAWAKGLKKLGYASDKNYAEKLIRIIEQYKLHKLN